nr:MAG TPA: hypothetical protein [Caudoviricetes sp.]
MIKNEDRILQIMNTSFLILSYRVCPALSSKNHH